MIFGVQKVNSQIRFQSNSPKKETILTFSDLHLDKIPSLPVDMVKSEVMRRGRKYVAGKDGKFLNETILIFQLKVYLFLVSSCLSKVEPVTAAVFFERKGTETYPTSNFLFNQNSEAKI